MGPFFRVLKPFWYKNGLDSKVWIEKGRVVSIDNRMEIARLTNAGIILPAVVHSMRTRYGAAAHTGRVRHRRVGIWLATTSFYSGGRIFLYQYASTLAALGAEVFYVTGLIPKWCGDYDPAKGLKFLRYKADAVPADLDLLVCDGKSVESAGALEYKKSHPRVPLVSFCFESPNWVGKFVPSVAGRMNLNKNVYLNSDRIVAISKEGRKYIREWVPGRQVDVLYPSINSVAFAQARKLGPHVRKRPYVVWSGRASNYKGGDVAVQAVWAQPFPLDLVVFGQVPAYRNTDKHMLLGYSSGTDVEKYRFMMGAAAVLAPSRFEGFGLVPGEAWMCGTPSIVYDLPVLHEIYGDQPRYVKFGDVEGFRRKIAEVVKAPKPKIDGSAAIARHGFGRMLDRVDCLPYHHIRRKSVTAIMICYYGPAVQQALRAIYPHVDQIRIAWGRVKAFPAAKPDDSLEHIRHFPDPDRKIALRVEREWRDKQAMREWCTADVRGSHLLIVDADEIYIGLDKMLASPHDFGCPRWVHFWHDGRHYVVNYPRWGHQRWGAPAEPFGSIANHYRFSAWRASNRWLSHCMAGDSTGKALADQAHNVALAKGVPGAVIYHLGHILDPGLMTRKHQFYLGRDGADRARVERAQAWHDWRGALGDCGDGVVKRVNWKLPAIVQEGIVRCMNTRQASAAT